MLPPKLNKVLLAPAPNFSEREHLPSRHFHFQEFVGVTEQEVDSLVRGCWSEGRYVPPPGCEQAGSNEEGLLEEHPEGRYYRSRNGGWIDTGTMQSMHSGTATRGCRSTNSIG